MQFKLNLSTVRGNCGVGEGLHQKVLRSLGLIVLFHS